jgi:hypothetical protein
MAAPRRTASKDEGALDGARLRVVEGRNGILERTPAKPRGGR